MDRQFPYSSFLLAILKIYVVSLVKSYLYFPSSSGDLLTMWQVQPIE